MGRQRGTKRHPELERAPGTRMARIRAELFERQDGCCYYCGQRMTLRAYPIDAAVLRDDDATVEHLVPRVLGGRDVPTNLVAACHRCNRVGARIDKWCVDVFGGRRLGRAAAARARRRMS